MTDTLRSQRARIVELEGLLADTTRKLENTQRALRAEEEEVERLANDKGHVLLGETETPAHLAAVELAIQRLASLLRDDVAPKPLPEIETDSSTPRLELIARAVQVLSVAHANVAPKPLPEIR